MLEIASGRSGYGVFQREIAVNQNISVKYLDHIITALKVAGLIANAKGKKSGYVLARNPSEITLYDIHSAFEPGIVVNDCVSCHFVCEREKFCAAREFWKGLNDQITTYFKNLTLKDMVDRHIELTGLNPVTRLKSRSSWMVDTRQGSAAYGQGKKPKKAD